MDCLFSNFLSYSIFEDHEGSNGVGLNGVINIGYAPFSFYGRNIFRRNNGTSSLNVSQNTSSITKVPIYTDEVRAI